MLSIYSFHNVLARWKTTLFTAAGFTLAVAALVVMLAFYSGVRKVCAVSGEAENVIILSQGLSDEIYSDLNTDTVTRISNLPAVLRDGDGRPLASREFFLTVTEHDVEADRYVFLEIRGVTSQAFQVHRRVRLVEGRMFEPAQGEVVIGQGLKQQRGLNLGDALKIGNRDWIVVGTFEAGGAAFETEAWCDINQLSAAFRRNSDCSVLVVRVPTAATARKLAHFLKSEFSLGVNALAEPHYYVDHAKDAKLIQYSALVIAVVMAIGAIFGAMNTMYATVNQRRKEISVLRILGFSRPQILSTFLVEGLLIAAIGGTAGILLGYFVNGWNQTVTVRERELAFAFDVNGTVILCAAAFSLAMGFLGGLLPAWSATKISPMQAMR